VLPDQSIIAIIQKSKVTGLYWDSSRKELHITADGKGEQEVVVYVNGKGEPKNVYFDGTAITSWVYDDTAKTVTFTVTLGSPHSITLSWFTPPKPTPTPEQHYRGGGRGGRPAYYCGDGKCTGSENYCSCEKDCEAPSCGTCEEVSCESGTPECIAKTPCAGNGECEEGENCASTPEDCKCAEHEECVDGACVAQPYCGDSVCQETENCRTCKEDCECPADTACVSDECKALAKCGDGACNANESFESCPADCPAPTPATEPGLEITPGASPAGPTGLFGLGNMGSGVIAGFLIVVIAVGLVFYLKQRKK